MEGPRINPELPVGKRIQYFRQRAGKTRAVLAGLLGKSESWLKAVETGRLLPPRLPMLVRIAEMLKVSLADLTGAIEAPAETFSGSAHPALPAVRAAMSDYLLGMPSGVERVSTQQLRERLSSAWAARHASPLHRTTLGELLPGLIRDAQIAVRAASDLRERRDAYALLSETMNLVTFYVAYQPAASLLWRAVERAMAAAYDAEDPRTIAMSAWSLAQAHRDSGEWEQAQEVTMSALRLLDPLLSDGPAELLGMWGALQAEAAYTAAKVGDQGVALHHLDEASRAAQRLPVGYYQTMTSFSTAILPAHAVTVHVELRKAGEAARHAAVGNPADIPSRPRRARHLIEVARAYHARRDYEATAELLDKAYEAAPETIQFNGYARQMVGEMMDRVARMRRRAHDLAEKVGMLA
ncbi:Helix-turn-helix domain-containing protein [Streptoalloteichus tenebrarius]|uniref:Helix-turn-helix domain-containing protein n=1 Tax=Streptoalloteichus tenebrarius (strain ATCC 17920 / DSM 40477 / JCM 4838 / CBS 697.72 / NBRC 16177 / NCIMB 11028 / NRRL B-12390 / A12253. 1 / ISP 5477) TaxID=1933 RepID=A0ABT1HWV8_STRSD|nr:helix-turn-helix transcriptional regulator [Streptoalloteichus tenebrarius]MCP2260013.1 Helix-turn-helix domain-containing protein [Streptoalloteichus tenebrarius]BFF03874.1 hypothetical protein GCM10020241_55490 [Streptoalloteichus tenebrarius]